LVIAIDAMGGDFAPEAPLEGIRQVAVRNADVTFKIFGNEAVLHSFFLAHPTLQERVQIIHTSEYVTNDTPAREALRGLKCSSMRLAIQEVGSGGAECVVSAGNTGAYMALAKVILKTLPGIERPAIARAMPTQKGECVVLDLGANVEVTPFNLVEFAIMGEVFARSVLHKENPSVGLLNVGSEELKGNSIVRQAQELIREQNILANFYGFVEGDDIFAGTTDVVVTDGFSGNIALKTAEGCARFFATVMKQKLMQSWLSRLGTLLAFSALREIRERFDPRNYNGAPFLGLQGIAVKSHGGTDAVGFARAIEVAIELVRGGTNEKISLGIAKMKAHTASQLVDLSMPHCSNQ
jgi:glycerol-3-phosphate acyltransferase PlsX